MDWARVKTILIIVFLIVNIFLIIKVVEKSNPKELKIDEIQNISSLLSQNNIILEPQMPTKISYMPRIKITNEIIEGDLLADKLIGYKKWNKMKRQPGEIIYTSEKKQLTVETNGTFCFIMNESPEVIGLNSEEKVKEYIYNILRTYTDVNGYQPGTLKKVKEGYEFDLKYFYKDNEIFNNYIETKVNQSGITILSHGLVRFDGFAGKTKKVMPVDAFIELIKNVDKNQKTTVKQILLGYYADINKNNEVIQYGEADPAWKIITDKGTYIFDGYTGKLILET